VRRYEASDREVYRVEAEKFVARGWKLPQRVLEELGVDAPSA
jgi:hypothetical protein